MISAKIISLVSALAMSRYSSAHTSTISPLGKSVSRWIYSHRGSSHAYISPFRCPGITNGLQVTKLSKFPNSGKERFTKLLSDPRGAGNVQSISRLFHSSKRSNDGSRARGSDKNPGFLRKILNKITGRKKTSAGSTQYGNDLYRGNDESESKYRQNDISGGLQTLLKDAPLAVRLMGRLVSPLLKNIANEFVRQGEEIDQLLDDARLVIGFDSSAVSALGEPFVCERPFMQSSSSMSVNGKIKKKIQVRFEVVGRNGSGTATMSAGSDLSGMTAIESLVLSMSNGSSVTIKNLNPRRRGDSGTGSGYSPNDIIDVEFEEKK
eukprot:CAMPEP_0194330074 /NCGR_PEP_ID=MMETSP0171-20130528/50466_1 /TAXON_ID=218684 /ORGANISM="Corethron pennatum, Strain L29A3" /LENGTH=321 /DNA_ID=CAMNT_0039091015 /DNA_START=1 /DNA_END=966 /DNA_ORIENTATION=+